MFNTILAMGSGEKDADEDLSGDLDDENVVSSHDETGEVVFHATTVLGSAEPLLTSEQLVNRMR